jgi:hypothetical protein
MGRVQHRLQVLGKSFAVAFGLAGSVGFFLVEVSKPEVLKLALWKDALR